MSVKAPEKTEYEIGKDPSRHYIRVELDGKDWESNLEEYLDRESPAAGEEGQTMYRIEADPRKDSELRKYTGSSRRIMLSCSKEAAKAWEDKYAAQAIAVLRPRADPNQKGSFEGFVDPTGKRFDADSGGILDGSGLIL